MPRSALVGRRAVAAGRLADVAGGVAGAPRLILRAEGAVVLVAACAAYSRTGGGWGLFALLFLVPDLSMLGYLRGPRFGAMTYNFAHSYLAPAALAAGAAAMSQPTATALALIWIAHIGFDRLLGYGLKQDKGFGHTHLGLTGNAARPRQA